jgi:putative ABC transport system permease protein
MLAAQVAFAVILVAGATLVARAYAGTHAVNPGFDVSETLTLQLTLPRSRYATAADHAQFAERALEELTSIPVVASAGVVSDLPFVGNALHFEVRPEAGERTAERMTVRPADPGFFRTLRVPVESGRLFDRRDRRGAPAVAIVNRTAANRLNRRGTIGARLVIASDAIRTVVGIVGDIKHEGLRSDEGPVVYVPFSQSTFDFQNWMGIVIRGSPLGSVAAGARAAIARVDPDQPLAAVRPMSAYVDEQLSPYRFGALVVLALAAAALTLAVTGIYGMTAFIVGRRIRELGIRLALGATRRGVIQLVLKQVAVVVALGSGVGVAAAMITNRLLQTALADAPTLSANAAALAAGWALLIGTAAVAAVLPARRAARIDPRSALEAE